MSTEIKELLKGKQWVLRFVETDYLKSSLGAPMPSGYQEIYTDVFDVTVLRLEFNVGKKVFNLGAVSDTVSDNDNPSNDDPDLPTVGFDFFVWLADLLSVNIATAAERFLRDMR